MNQTQLNETLRLHKLWLEGSKEGKQANLSRADLSGANLYGANLSGANLSWANLYGANLYGANLSLANLYGANLYGANLYEANLTGADLSWATLYGANLSDANLSLATLYGANLKDATYNPVLLFSMVNWGKVSDKLTIELMKFDAANHPNPKSFNTWKETGVCPFSGTRYKRAINFSQDKYLWNNELLEQPLLTSFTLLQMLFKEKKIKYNES